MFFARELTQAEKLEAIRFLRAIQPTSAVLKMFLAKPLAARKAHQRNQKV